MPASITIEILYFDGCPNHEQLLTHLPLLLEHEDITAEIVARNISDTDTAVKASAHHTVYGSAKRAVLQSLVRNSGPLRRVNDGHNCQTLAIACWQVVVSANSRAASKDVGPGNNGMAEWTYVSHLRHGQWLYVGGWGEGIGLACKRVGIPRKVSRDLGIYCS